MTYKLLRHVTSDGVLCAIVVGESAFDLAGRVSGADGNDVTSLLQNWDAVSPQLDAFAAAPAGDATPLDSLALVAPLLPGNIHCAAANYYDHYREVSGGKERTKEQIAPYFFLKSTRAVTGPTNDVEKPSYSDQLDWEVEIVAVIGRRARRVSADRALEHVAFYCVGNDMGLRDVMWRDDWPVVKSDWFASKSFEGSAPMGPWLTPASEVANPQNLKMQTWVNDRIEQDTSSKDMIYSIAEQIESLSARLTLEPGDVIFTGTGAGVGEGDGKKRYMKVGDVCTVTIEALGTLTNRIV